jgi:hypothetical protein
MSKKNSHKDSHEYKEGHHDGYLEGQISILKVFDEILSTGKTDLNSLGNNNNSKFIELKKKIMILVNK